MAALERYLPRCRIFLLDGQKFRTNLLVLFFDLPLGRETATKTALLAEVLKRGEDPAKAARQGEELYGALWDVSVVKKGDRQLLLFSLETLKTVEMEDALSFLREQLLRPLEQGAFSEKAVERQKAILRRKLDSRKDDKKAFARRRALEETTEGTAFAISGDGYTEDLEEIHGDTLFAWYRKIVETAEVKVFFCGDKAERTTVLSLRQNFPGRVAVREKIEQDSDCHEPPRFVQEETEGEQARLLLGFEADVENSRRQAALLLLNQLLGGDPDSLLFRKVREERGLCYDIKSYRYPLSPYLFVQAGIQEKDAKETGKLVLKCLDGLKKENVSSEKLRQAKESILRDYDSLADNPWAMVDFFAEQALQGKELSTEKFLRQMERVEPEDIMWAANHLKLKTVYLLRGKEDGNGEN
ncbi:MAG: M16 family metallopeptidase [Anaerotignum sp.]